jgi:hypothetical protein
MRSDISVFIQAPFDQQRELRAPGTISHIYTVTPPFSVLCANNHKPSADANAASLESRFSPLLYDTSQC